MSELPTGTVTFLFTDMEGSTELARQFPAAWPAIQRRHAALLQDAITSHQGYLFQTIGDEIDAAFANVLDALAAAWAAQRALQVEDWGDTGTIRVRMGLHTGPATLKDDNYEGYLALSHTKRLMSIASGGQILLSEAAEALLRDSLPPGISLQDLGEHRLKDFERPERIYQVLAAGLPAEFPPLQSFSDLPNNLPVQLTSFVGRERELPDVKQLLAETHLLTMTGPGGTGKTRLSLQLASEVLEEYHDGVWFVELAPLSDPTLVPQTIASTLGVREQPGRTVLDSLVDYTRTKKMLLILDNCEHLIEACAQITDHLLRAAPHVKILATSREALGITGEIAYRVPSLPLPEAQQLHDVKALSQNDCIHLFMDRARAVYPAFQLRDKNASAIVDICRRLDGIPLAIELAAARTKVFPAEEIAARLDDRFRLLTGGSRTALERHQTLFALIEWSYHLLTDEERVLLCRLSIFAGGWSFAAAEAVCSEGIGEDMLDLLTHLVDKSLVVFEEEGEEGRYRLPETIRQYARQKLLDAGDSEQARDRHLQFFLHYAESAELKLHSPEQLTWLEHLETEHDNLRTAMAWSLESEKGDLALRLTGALYYFLVIRGYFSEGKRWVEDAQALSELEQNKKTAAGEFASASVDQHKAYQAKALYASAVFHLGTLDMNKAHTLAEESLRLWRELGNKWWISVTLELAALIVATVGDTKAALAYLEEGISLARDIEDPWPLATCLVRYGDALKPRGDAAAAHPFLEEGVALARSTGDKILLSEGLRELGSIYYIEGDFKTATSLTEEALADARAIGSNFQTYLAYWQLVIISFLQNDPVQTKRYSLEMWDLGKNTGSAFTAAMALLPFGLSAISSGEFGKGVRLLAALDVLFAQSGFKTSESSDPSMMVLKQAVEKARAHLDPEGFEAAQQEGRLLTLDQAIALATENESRKDSPSEEN